MIGSIFRNDWLLYQKKIINTKNIYKPTRYICCVPPLFDKLSPSGAGSPIRQGAVWGCRGEGVNKQITDLIITTLQLPCLH